MSIYDKSVRRLFFNKVEKRRLTIGYFFEDGLVDISEANRQAVLVVKAALEEQGHTLVEFSLNDAGT